MCTARLTSVVLFAGLAVMTGCAQFPELNRTLTPTVEAADYPDLVPMPELLARAQGPRTEPALEQRRLNARVSALKARAARLRRGVLSGAERVRLREGLR